MPHLLRGASAIGEHLSIGGAKVSHLDKQRHLPTFRLPGDSAPHATANGLDEWRLIPAVAELLD